MLNDWGSEGDMITWQRAHASGAKPITTTTGGGTDQTRWNHSPPSSKPSIYTCVLSGSDAQHYAIVLKRIVSACKDLQSSALLLHLQQDAIPRPRRTCDGRVQYPWLLNHQAAHFCQAQAQRGRPIAHLPCCSLQGESLQTVCEITNRDNTTTVWVAHVTHAKTSSCTEQDAVSENMTQVLQAHTSAAVASPAGAAAPQRQTNCSILNAHGYKALASASGVAPRRSHPPEGSLVPAGTAAPKRPAGCCVPFRTASMTINHRRQRQVRHSFAHLRNFFCRRARQR